MKRDIPSFVIKYMECSEPTHSPEKLNLICLNKKCQAHPLICSLCCLQKHKGHDFKPLKIHLEALYARHANTSIYSQQLAELQSRRRKLLHHLQKCVEVIAQQICKLEESIQQAYDNIKQQLQQNEWRRTRFTEFYLSMVKDNYGDPHFQIQNYIFQEKTPLLTDRNIFEQSTKALLHSLSTLHLSFIDNSPGQPAIAELPITFLLPPNITQEGNVFSQTNFTINAPQLCLLNEDIAQWKWQKMKVTVMAFGPFSYLAFGTVKREDFQKANFQFKDALSSQYFSSDGKGKTVSPNFLMNVGVDTTIEFLVQKGKMKIETKSNNTTFNISESNTFLFFVIEGHTKIRLDCK